ncbi:MAG: c-type cytochrome [Pirellulaceae bacterium]|nr:c-type cytochrome [Pirellulaceae bacterium]
MNVQRIKFSFLIALATTLFVTFPVDDSTICYGQLNSQEIGKELPRVPFLSPQKSLHTIATHAAFRVELVAAEPLVHDPVAIDFDENGRAYVVQLPPYNSYIVENVTPHGSIVLLEDTDRDGRYDKSTSFVDEISYPTAIACWDGGVLIGNSPDLLFFRDTDGDGQADEKHVVFTGFGSDKAGETHLNSIRWGIDHRFHISTSMSGGEVKAVADPEAQPVSVRNRGIIFDPRDWTKFELTSGSGQHGMSMDDWGRKFVCSNSVPAQTLMYDDRYIARNPHVQAPPPAIDIAPDGKHTKLFRISPPEPWRVLRTRLRRERQFRGPDEGGKPFGFFTAATGITIYRGDAWPDEYRGNLLVGDVANNLMYRALLEPDELQLVARRADQDVEFLASSDIWFRPVQFANAPDGSLYILDMYRELIEGAAFLPPEFFEHLDALSGNDRGRIYRMVANDGNPLRKSPRLDSATTAELVAMLAHPNGWHRDTASRLLYERQDPTATGPLREFLTSSPSPIGRATALYALHGLDALDDNSVFIALSDTSPHVRIHALRLAEHVVTESSLVAAKMIELAEDVDKLVRYQAAFSLGSMPGPTAAAALFRIAVLDGEDRWMRVAILSSVSDLAGTLFQLLASHSTLPSSSHGQELLVSLARQIGADHRESEIATVLQSLDLLADSQDTLPESIVLALLERHKEPERKNLLAAEDGKAAAILKNLLDQAKRTANDSDADDNVRASAIHKLRLAPFAAVQPLIHELLHPAQPQPVQVAALETIAEFEEMAAAVTLLQTWSALGPTLRTSAAETLLSRPAWVHVLFDAIEEGNVPRGSIDAARVKLLQQHPDQKIAERADKLFNHVQASERQAVFEHYRPVLEMDGDAGRGKMVFEKNCSACHRLEGVGRALGAELKGIRQRGMASVLLNILDPNREVKPEFLNYIIAVEDGRVLTGMISAETANNITISRPDGTSVTLQRSDIEEMRSSGYSFMPEGIEKNVNKTDMADLLSYLNSVE